MVGKGGLDMTMIAKLAAAAVLVAGVAAPALAGASGFALVNQAGGAVSGIALRRTGGSDWQSVGGGASDGARTKVSFSDPDCAFDVRATVAGHGETVWSRVNLCEVSSVTLHRDASGTTWVDYD